MARDVDPKRTRKALRLVRKLAQSQKAEGAEGYSGWEKTFLDEVEGRLEAYGSAFRDLSKGAPDEALSRLQTLKLKEIAAKAAGKPRRGFKPRSKPRRETAPDD